MNRILMYLLLIVLWMSATVWSCECGLPMAPCAYLAADAIFLGRVSFTNDDGSGSFSQATLVRFDVEERFKGIAPDVHDIWADPGSFTSCYKEYDLGKRYLVFATRMPQVPTYGNIMRDSEGKTKPLPRGYDPAKPPNLYYAPECAGSRLADRHRDIDGDLRMLRDYRAGASVPRVLGHLYLYPFRGWPALNGPALAGARVTMSNGVATLRATTDATGRFSLTNAPTGHYKVRAELPPFHMARETILHVGDVGCGYVDVRLTTTSTIQGIVLDHRGKPAPNVPVGILLKDKGLEDTEDYDLRDGYAMGATTDISGRFAITGLPDADFYLAAGSVHPTTQMPYRRVYHPYSRALEQATVLRLKPGEHRRPLVLWLEPPLEKTHARVSAVLKDGRPGLEVAVWALDGGTGIAEYAKTDRNGVALVPCLRGLPYELEAHALHRELSWRIDVKSMRAPLICRGPGVGIRLLLDQSVRQ